MAQKVKNGILVWGLFLLSIFWLPGSWMPFHTGKWVFLSLLALITFGTWCFRREILVPKLSRNELLWISVLFLGILASLFWFYGFSVEMPLLDRWSFFLLVYFSWLSFRDGLKWEDFFYPLLLAISTVALYGLYQIYQVGFPGEMPYTQVGSLLGHSNNAAQFIGLSIFLLWACAEKRIYSAAFSTVLGISYLYLSRGRSALLAFAIAGLVALFLYRKKLFGKIFAGVALATILIIGGLQATKIPLNLIASGAIFREKPSMVTYREDVWKQTLKMIQEKPLGVGVDLYSFHFVPYHQKGTTVSTDHIALSPHNEFLRYLAEDGIPLALFFFATVILFFRKWIQVTSRQEREIFYPFFAFLLFEMFFQFPFQNPMPSFFAAIFAGYGMSKFWQAKPIQQRAPVLPVFFLLFGFLFVKVGVSRKFETSTDPGLAQVSCSWAPTNWQACLNYSRLLMGSGKLNEAREVINAVLIQNPANFTATRHLAVVAFRQNRLLEGCFHTWTYDYVFGGKSDVRENYEKNCPKKFRDYFDRKKPTRYYHR